MHLVKSTGIIPRVKHCIFCLKITFTFTNSEDLDEMQQYAAFHLGLHCLQKVLI